MSSLLDISQYRRHRESVRQAQRAVGPAIPTPSQPPASGSPIISSTVTVTTVSPSNNSPSASELGGLRGKLAELVAKLIEVAPQAGIPGPIMGMIGLLALKRIAHMSEAELRPALESTVVTLQSWLAEHPNRDSSDSDSTTESDPA